MTPDEAKPSKSPASCRTWILGWIEWFVQVGEGLLVLALIIAIFCTGWRLIWNQSKIQPILQVDWRVFLAVLIPLFFRTLRTFIEEIVEAFGVKRQPKQAAVQADPEEETRPRAISMKNPSQEG
jgi:hypothetical protein